MKVEAIKREDGVLLPMLEVFRDIQHDTILLEVEILEPLQPNDYAALDQLVGLCETEQTDASEHHDRYIYGRRNANDFH